jgi:Outer membrane cytochrome MtrC/MtrF-like, domains II/IV/Cytochrome c7 and related cytochrome c
MKPLLLFVLLAAPGFAQTPPQVPAAKPENNFFIHAYHAEKLGTLDCNMCHVPVKDGSVMLQRPGHTQCLVCHDDDFNKDLKPKVCAQCHAQFPPEGASDLVQFPRYSKTRTILFEFAHSKHVDVKARTDPKTGFRSDCTFCHKFEPNGQFAKFPTHQECATCHSKAGFTPQLTASMDAASCRGCHTPEEIENPGFTKDPRMIGAHVASGKYVNIKFSHTAHFKAKDEFMIQCTTCHYAVPRSTGLANLSLPMMLDCVECHDTSKKISAEFRMSNCKTCHDDKTGVSGAAPANHTRNLKPDFHTESFRVQHAAESAAPNAKCFVCHQNVTPTLQPKLQCVGCHQVMRPVSHTARWKDDVHGKFAALDRTTCATCHVASYCSTCHNELPRSHVPLPLFKAGAHATLAMLDQRSCLTCHTFQNTCAECHTNQLLSKPAVVIKK